VKLNIKALALASGILWGAALFVVTLANVMWPGYGKAFLEDVASIYPGYSGDRSLAQVLIGTGYALVDGGVAGAVLAWLYNCLARG